MDHRIDPAPRGAGHHSDGIRSPGASFVNLHSTAANGLVLRFILAMSTSCNIFSGATIWRTKRLYTPAASIPSSRLSSGSGPPVLALLIARSGSYVMTVPRFALSD